MIGAGFIPIGRDREYGDKQFNVLFVHHTAISEVLPQLFSDSGVLQFLRDRPPALTPAPAAPLEAMRARTPCRSVAAALQAEIPIIIPCFNTVTYVRGMVEQLRARGHRRIVLIDNASTYAPMLDYLQASGPDVTVIAQAENKGPRDVFLDPVSLALLPQFFCVTDPDLLFNPDMPDDFLAQLVALTETLSIGKAGLALDLADRAAMRDEMFEIAGKKWTAWDWEEQFWSERLHPLASGDPVFRANIDTTFCVYNKRFFSSADPLYAVRVAGRYTCRHLPWYKDTGLPEEEERHYRGLARDSSFLRDESTDPERMPRY